MLELEDIFTSENINNALDYLSTKHDSYGSDGVYLSELSAYLKENGIVSKILSGSYVPKPAIMYEIPNSSGGLRNIYKLSSCDRLITRILSDKLQSEFDDIFSPCCIAYRPDKWVHSCVPIIRRALDNGCRCCAQIDIRDFFGTISHPLLGEFMTELDISASVYMEMSINVQSEIPKIS